MLVVDTLTILIRGCDTYSICILLLVRALGSVEVFGTHTWPGFRCWVFLCSLVGRKGIPTKHPKTLIVSKVSLYMSWITVGNVTVYAS